MEKKGNLAIAIVHPFLDVFGGAEKIALTLANNTAEKYGSCDLYSPWFEPKNLDYIHTKGVKVITARITPRISRLFGTKFNPFLLTDVWRLAAQFKNKKYDIIVTINWPANMIVHLAIRFFGLKARLNAYLCLEPDHGLHYKRLFGRFPLAENASLAEQLKVLFGTPYLQLMRLIDLKVVNQKDCVMTLSKNIREKVRLVFGNAVFKRTSAVLHDFVNESVFYPDATNVEKLKKKHNIPLNHTVILSLGRLAAHPKQTHLVIEAARELSNYTKKFTVFIGGSGPQKNYLVSLVKKYHLEDKVIFLGFVKEKELPAYYNLCDVFLFTAYDEPSGPLTMLEAMACEKPVIVSKSGGPLEIIKDNIDGLFASPKSASDYARKVKYVIEHPDTSRKIAANGKKKVLAEYTESLFFKHFDDFLKEKLIEKKKTNSV